MARVQIKSEKLTPFGGIFMVMEQFDSMLSSVIDQALGQRCSIIGYQFIETEKYDAKPTYKKFLGYRPVTLSL